VLHLAVAADVYELTLAGAIEIGRDNRAGERGLFRVVGH
jgi:hypothetical protein